MGGYFGGQRRKGRLGFGESCVGFFARTRYFREASPGFGLAGLGGSRRDEAVVQHLHGGVCRQRRKIWCDISQKVLRVTVEALNIPLPTRHAPRPVIALAAGTRHAL